MAKSPLRCWVRTPPRWQPKRPPLPASSRCSRVDRPENEHPLAATFAPQIVALSADYSHVFGPSTSFGKDLMPRVAGLLGVAQVSDLMAVESAYRFRRPIYAGNAIITIEADPARKLVATVRVASFEAAANGGSAAIESKSLSAALPSHTRYVGAKSGFHRSARPADGGAGGIRRPCTRQRGEFQDSVQPSRQARRGRGRLARRGRRRLRRERNAGSARQAKSSLPKSTSPSASPAPSST